MPAGAIQPAAVRPPGEDRQVPRLPVALRTRLLQPLPQGQIRVCGEWTLRQVPGYEHTTDRRWRLQAAGPWTSGGERVRPADAAADAGGAQLVTQAGGPPADTDRTCPSRRPPSPKYLCQLGN